MNVKKEWKQKQKRFPADFENYMSRMAATAILLQENTPQNNQLIIKITVN